MVFAHVHRRKRTFIGLWIAIQLALVCAVQWYDKRSFCDGWDVTGLPLFAAAMSVMHVMGMYQTPLYGILVVESLLLGLLCNLSIGGVWAFVMKHVLPLLLPRWKKIVFIIHVALQGCTIGGMAAWICGLGYTCFVCSSPADSNFETFAGATYTRVAAHRPPADPAYFRLPLLMVACILAVGAACGFAEGACVAFIAVAWIFLRLTPLAVLADLLREPRKWWRRMSTSPFFAWYLAAYTASCMAGATTLWYQPVLILTYASSMQILAHVPAFLLWLYA
jgi:hypothetical protein